MQLLFLLIYQNQKGVYDYLLVHIFRMIFFHKNVPYLILYQFTKFQYHAFFPSQEIKQEVLNSYLDNW